MSRAEKRAHHRLMGIRCVLLLQQVLLLMMLLLSTPSCVHPFLPPDVHEDHLVQFQTLFWGSDWDCMELIGSLGKH